MNCRTVLPRHGIALFLTLAATLAAAPLQASDGSGESAWGPIPARADSVTARYESTPRSAWEWPLHSAWWLAKAPFEVVNYGAEKAVVGIEESGLLYRLGQLLGPVELPYGFRVNGVASQLVGVGGGLDFYHDALFSSRGRFQVKTVYTSKRDARASGGYLLGLDDRGSTFELGAGYRRRSNARFFGEGPFSPESDLSYFTQEAFWVGTSYRQALVEETSVQADVLYSTMRHRGPREPNEDIPLEMVFEDRLPTGWGQNSDGWLVGLSLQRDTSIDQGRPREGGVQRARVAYFRPDESSQADFWSYRVEAQQIFDLWWDRALALRSYWSWIDGGGEDVHFQRQMTNDDPDHLRGYDDFRWRGRGLTALNAEYRWPVWAYRAVDRTGVDAYTFVDTGQVFDDHDQLSLDALTVSGGFGLRLATRRGFAGRIEVGFSDEDTVFRIQTHQLFQYDRRGLYHGRNPIPSR